MSSFIFLRFFAPAILSPNLFQLTPHHTVSERQPLQTGKPVLPHPAGGAGLRPGSLRLACGVAETAMPGNWVVSRLCS